MVRQGSELADVQRVMYRPYRDSLLGKSLPSSVARSKGAMRSAVAAEWPKQSRGKVKGKYEICFNF